MNLEMPAAKSARNEFFDACKGIGILCVFYGHTAYWGTLPSRIVFSVHMPLFFLLSGIFFDVTRIPDWASLVRKVWRNLLLPYCFFVVIWYGVRYDITVSRWSSNPVAECMRILHGDGFGSVWFLSCLAFVQAFLWFFYRMLNRFRYIRGIKLLAIFSLGGVAHILSRIVSPGIANQLPFMLASVPAAMLFVLLGIWLREPLVRFSHSKQKPLFVALFVMVLFVFLIIANTFYRGTFDIRGNGFSVLVMPSCFLGMAIIFLLSKLICAAEFARNVFSRIGSRSLFLFALELPLSYIVCRTTLGWITYPMWLTKHLLLIEPIRMVVILSTTYLCSYPAVWILDKLRANAWSLSMLFCLKMSKVRF